MYVCMYVCMYVGMYVCMYVCMCVCVYVCVCVCMYVCMYVCVCVYVCMYVCMYVRTCGLDGRYHVILRNSVHNHQNITNLPLSLTRSRKKSQTLPFPSYDFVQSNRNIPPFRTNVGKSVPYFTSSSTNPHNHGCGNIV